MTHLPAVELVDLLKSAYGPCPEFKDACRDFARWALGRGHVPRGYIGACGTLDEVEVILLLAEPGDPFDGDKYSGGLGASDFVNRASQNTRRSYEQHATGFHANMWKILNLLFPGAGLDEQLRRVWIGETYLCPRRPRPGEFRQRQNVRAPTDSCLTS